LKTRSYNRKRYKEVDTKLLKLHVTSIADAGLWGASGRRKTPKRELNKIRSVVRAEDLAARAAVVASEGKVERCGARSALRR
jgi:hypothetical protein